MFAVIKTGGKQYKVSEGDVLMVEKLNVEGDSITFDQVLMTADGETINLGKPILSGVMVTAKVLEEGKAKKKMVFRYKAKTRQRKKKGHRQPYTKVQITKISA
ncbi:MAG: 50S ribosomal protein L21 [Candidatus Yanofskybacteria bacterium RIFCSPHIGHO2_02_FULL_50_12]|uniref:Large ribosomal subunit protein bL21 n=1 Tax=Candidatus Yanofskybacteria bacterium RIFCSPHIGHO2_02_FULL_50_12 TaxID=1802685 RepID=A0A1F8FVJ9_9BACT|nr:MAG: 50S ribosomal protein L21 [Candidatus Yanofskybacteria bacterium RIFCSPHIGHO2_02_FULL_50_12]